MGGYGRRIDEGNKTMKYSEKIGIIMAIVMIIGFIARMIMGVCILLGSIK